MQLYCQTCQAAFAGVSHCPKCGGRLLSPQESFVFSGTQKGPPPDPVPTSLGHRVALGAGVGLGLYFGMREVAVACGAVTPGTPLLTSGGTVDLVLRVVGVLAGAVLAGASREKGLSAGAAAGLAAAGLTALGDVYTAGGLAAAGMGPLLLAVVLAALAGPAGAIGAWVWPPEPELPPVSPTRGSSRGSSLLMLADEDAKGRAPRPTVWLRVLAGAAVAVAGLLATEEIRHWLARGSLGMLQIAGPHRGPVVGFQIAVFLLGLGGAVAGATTGAGFRHGVLAGLVAAVGVYIAAANSEVDAYPAIEGYFVLLDRTPEPLADTAAAAEVLGVVFALCTAGGWLGGQLFPPLAPPHMRKQRLVSQT